MKPLLWLLVLFAAAVAVTLAARFDPGYVLVVVPPWRLEMSFVLAALALALLYLLIQVAARLFRLALSLPADVRAWRGRQAEDELSRAVAAYLAGQSGPAHKLAASAFAHDRAALAGLVAAHAALAEGDHAAARRYIEGLEAGAEELAAARRAVEARLADPETRTNP
jgi:HemY protein